jgi:hypothetical protein
MDLDEFRSRKKILRRLVQQLPDRVVVEYAKLLCAEKPRINGLSKYLKRAICQTIKRQKDSYSLELLIKILAEESIYAEPSEEGPSTIQVK